MRSRAAGQGEERKEMAVNDARDPRRHGPDHDTTTHAEDDEHPVERAVTSVRYGIDQVADKVKGLLRSDG